MTAFIELVVASRTDAYLRESVTAANARAEFIEQSFKELFPRPDAANPEYELIPHIVCLILEAMALEGMTLNSELTTKILTVLKTFRALNGAFQASCRNELILICFVLMILVSVSSIEGGWFL